tara:strand:+ start:1698 stop:1844 length:147 start_codon:yes stop_codon:yes gene_type:complete
MSCKKDHQSHEKATKRLHDDIRKSKKDVVERFLSILWRREVDLKLTTK